MFRNQLVQDEIKTLMMKLFQQRIEDKLKEEKQREHHLRMKE